MNTADMPIIELQGTPLERGTIYGESARELIAANIESWRADLGNFCQNNQSRLAQDTDSYINTFFRIDQLSQRHQPLGTPSARRSKRHRPRCKPTPAAYFGPATI